MMANPKLRPSWTELKHKRSDIDRAGLPEYGLAALLSLLEPVRRLGGGFGYGVEEEMDASFRAHGVVIGKR
jgi:hypothetical protein